MLLFLILLLKRPACILKLITSFFLILIILECSLGYVKIGIFFTVVVLLYVVDTLTLFLSFCILAIIKVNVVVKKVL